MDYRVQYEKTVEQLFFKTQELIQATNTIEEPYLVLSDISQLIGTFYASLDSLQGQRKINAENALKTLYRCFEFYGRSYLRELEARKRNYQLNEALLEASKKIEQLQAEINILKNIDSL